MAVGLPARATLTESEKAEVQKRIKASHVLIEYLKTKSVVKK